MDDQLATQLASAMSGRTAERGYRADPEQTSARFTVKEKAGLLTANGAIPVVDAAVTVGADGLPRGSASLDISAIDTGNGRRDKDLRGRHFFDTTTFPLMNFRSVSTRRTADGVVVDGLLTVRGEDCPLSLVATLTARSDGTLAVRATGRFDRMTSPLRRTPRVVINRTIDIVVEAVLTPVGA